VTDANADLMAALAKFKADILKWMLVQTVVIIAGMVALHFM